MKAFVPLLVVWLIAVFAVSYSPPSTVAFEDQCIKRAEYAACAAEQPSVVVPYTWRQWCASSAHYKSLRLLNHIKPGCRP